MKEKTLTDYRNRRFQQPYAHALTACSAVVEAPFWSSDARLAELESLTSDDVQACALPRPRPGRPPGRAPHGAADASVFRRTSASSSPTSWLRARSSAT